ncbi:MAG: hypothetical protein RM347_014315 [Nostoc sp. ChiQUE02]|nr:hypothetical protein [Nostoc sp. ChiQUE02]
MAIALNHLFLVFPLKVANEITYTNLSRLKIFSNKDDFESKQGITKDSSMCGAIFLV